MAVTLSFGTVGYDIFVNIWQSNNYSSYHLDPVLDVGHARIYQMDQSGVIAQVTAEPLSYKGGTTSADGQPIGNILAFCRDYYLPNRLTAGRKILIVPCAWGGTGFSTNHWGIVSGVGRSEHEATITRVNAAVAALPGSVIKACFCHGGEADAFWDATVKPDGSPGGYPLGDSRLAFIDYTVAEVADFRARWTGGSGVPFFFGHMAPAWLDTAQGGPGYYPGSAVAIQTMASYVSNSLSVSAAGLTNNNRSVTPPNDDIYGGVKYLHFDAISQRGGTENGRTETNPWSKRHWTAYQTLVP